MLQSHPESGSNFPCILITSDDESDDSATSALLLLSDESAMIESELAEDSGWELACGHPVVRHCFP